MAKLLRKVRGRTRRNLKRKPKRLVRGKPRIKPSSRRIVHHDEFESGYALGYAEGLRRGQDEYEVPLDGTSIIIANFNKLELLKQCIESIRAHTPNPHEIIVVDNASTDGSAQYLESCAGTLRFHIHEVNRGFSGAVNTGLMMAKGRTICMLNNDIIVTKNWLTNLLNVLNSDPSIGIVGPVTNYIGGSQQINVPYNNLNHMHTFAARHNVSNASLWQPTDRLVGFCYLLRKETFEAIGYMDEGYAIGNYEDDDYIIRTRLTGRKLMIARDTFIHHVGSQSMKALGDRLQEVNDKNAAFFSAKWANAHDWVNRVRSNLAREERGVLRAQSFYPSHIAVTGLSDTIYWVEHGTKYPLTGPVHIPVVKLSQIDLFGYGTGPVMDAKTAEAKWNERTAGDGSIPDGGIFVTENGRWYQRKGGSCHEFVSQHAIARWSMEGRVTNRSEAERSKLQEGLPLIAAPMIFSYHL
ncbi:glycosyltransferase family 2 protein [Paenibacillus sp. 1001270B_150601_E10]|uniref:glycosyltransferase family 2 protein n=1 Tax=Paenibacillus sp. 1001270B_150601_E10 TaxID=2787079 RepID=UPI00189D6D10|nr:glycosyltransferase family 2 protein [Paenibacillus sp. 1001270B_150601_E10]